VRYFVIAAGILFGLMFVDSLTALIVLGRWTVAGPIYITRLAMSLGMALWALYVLLKRRR
jgi:hypothetical protein